MPFTDTPGSAPGDGGCTSAQQSRGGESESGLEARSALGAGEAGGADHQRRVVYQRGHPSKSRPSKSDASTSLDPRIVAIIASACRHARIRTAARPPARLDGRARRHRLQPGVGRPRAAPHRRPPRRRIRGARLAAIFGPQHGFRSDVQENMIETRPRATTTCAACRSTRSTARRASRPRRCCAASTCSSSTCRTSARASTPTSTRWRTA